MNADRHESRLEGSTIVTAAVILTLLAIASFIAVLAFQALVRGGKTAEILSDLEDVRRYIKVNSQCPPDSCIDGDYVSVKALDNVAIVIQQPVTSGAYTRIGNSPYYVRAKCKSCDPAETPCTATGNTHRVVVEYIRGRVEAGATGTPPEPTPLASNPNTGWNNWRELFLETVGQNPYWCLFPVGAAP